MSVATQLEHTNVSVENKELMAIFRDQKEKGWSVSDTRTQGKSDSKFMGEVEIQEAGFEARKMDIQEGLRKLIQDELETLKDLIVTYADGEYFFKVTGGPTPEYYEARTDTKGMVLNPLTDVLTGDFNIKVDIISAMRPNKEKRKRDTVEFLTWLTNPNTLGFLQSSGQMPNVELIKDAAEDFGFNRDNILTEAPQPQDMGGGMGEEGMPQPQDVVGGQGVI